jgi:predicted alpha/beta hydrolase family esterase
LPQGQFALAGNSMEATMTNDHAPTIEQSPLILTVPGLANSGADHWQTLWEQQRSNCHRVELGQWDQPHRNSWVNQLNHTIRAAGRPVVLVAHSLGCIAVAWWALLEAADAGQLVAGALLVAPPDVEMPCDERLAGFAPTPAAPLPFPTIVVASRNDPYLTIRAARQLAHAWHADFADAGAIGHINAASAIADWPFGRLLLDRLLARITSSGDILADAPVHAGEAPRVAHAREVSPARTQASVKSSTNLTPASR